MPRKRHKPEEIVAKLRQVDVLASPTTFSTSSARWRVWRRLVGIDALLTERRLRNPHKTPRRDRARS